MKALLSQIYRLAVAVRRLCYAGGLLSVRRLERPVISVGNLTVGGTGKTPLVLFLARALQRAGHQPVILSRGYGGSNRQAALLVTDGRRIVCGHRECGDEPYLMAQKLEGVPVVVGRDRYQAGRLAEDSCPRAVHLLDDGFQHLGLHRDLNLLVLDATDPFGGGRLLPAGRLREPLAALARADSILVTRAHQGAGLEGLEQTTRRFNPLVTFSFFHHDATALVDLATRTRHPLGGFLGRRVVALAAIGNPDSFLADLAHYQLRLGERFLFRDHHPFRQQELDRALQAARAAGAVVVTTEKDAVRLQGLDFGPGEILALEIEMRAEDPEGFARQLREEMASLSESE